MKLLVITAIEEYQQDVIQILKQAEINIFSVTETKGIKNEEESIDVHAWFGNKSGATNSILAFSFSEEAKATRALELIDVVNEKKIKFPIRGFVLAVENSTK